MTIQIKDLTVSNEIDMTAVRGGATSEGHGMCSSLTVYGFQQLVDKGDLNNPYALIATAAVVDIDGTRCTYGPA